MRSYFLTPSLFAHKNKKIEYLNKKGDGKPFCPFLIAIDNYKARKIDRK